MINKNMSVLDGLSQKQIYESIKKYNHLSIDPKGEIGSRALYLSSNAEAYSSKSENAVQKYTKSTQPADNITVQGVNTPFVLDNSLTIGYDKAGFKPASKEEAANLNKQSQIIVNMPSQNK